MRKTLRGTAIDEADDGGPHALDLLVEQKKRIAELEAALSAIASRDVPNPNADWAEVEFAAATCDRLDIKYETKWDQ